MVLDARGDAVPAFVQWGADLGELDDAHLLALADAGIPATANAAVDSPIRLRVLPQLRDAWQGRPALVGSRAPGRFRLTDVDTSAENAVRFTLAAEGLEVVAEYRLTAAGLLRSRLSVTNLAAVPFDVAELNVILPLPARATELLDFAGHWSGERRPQRTPIQHGAWLRESRHGRPGHDASFLTVAGTPSFGFRSGEVWAAHLGWSGNQRIWVERQISGISVLGAGELLEPGEVSLAEGESYTTPWLSAAWSRDGLDAASARFHAYLREGEQRERPIILNTWEAVYFNHDEPTLRRLADAGARAGVERFVLDDGWMTGRTDDARALGDWTVDPVRWPNGLGPLIDYVTGLDLDFGLWVEPEMANPDSRLAREHPDWILADEPVDDGSAPLLARNQLVVDLANPEAYTAIFGALDSLLREYDIRYLKWDHNRDLLVTRTREQTLAAYRLMDELLEAHPDVEIESCASGGGRVDLGILERTTRVWASDTNDPLERQAIYRYSSLLLPPELLGVHLGAPTAHTTGRTHSPAFRFATALFGWAGIEWNISKVTEPELDEVARWLHTYKQLRPILHTGSVVRADRADPALWVHGVVTADATDAVFAIVEMAAQRDAIPAPVLLPGLDPDRDYTVQVVDVGALPRYLAVALPPWLIHGSFVLPGRALAEVGFAAPPLAPEQAIVLRVTAV